MKYQVHIQRTAEKEIDRLPQSVHRRLSNKILSLGENPRPRGSKKLVGIENHRLRIGDYRILYDIDDNKKIVIIIAVGHRSEVYRWKRS